MTNDAAALRVAIDLLHMPSRVRLARAAPLPSGVVMLLRVATGDEEALAEAARMTGRSPELMSRSAAFFIEQLMLCPEADSYRVLGVSPRAAMSELRRNMALLLTWLHPDLGRHANRTALVQRVTRAWDDLKTPERRQHYDARRAPSKPGVPAGTKVKTRRSARGAPQAKGAPQAPAAGGLCGSRRFPRRGWWPWSSTPGRGPSGVDR